MTKTIKTLAASISAQVEEVATERTARESTKSWYAEQYGCTFDARVGGTTVDAIGFVDGHDAAMELESELGGEEFLVYARRAQWDADAINAGAAAHRKIPADEIDAYYAAYLRGALLYVTKVSAVLES